MHSPNGLTVRQKLEHLKQNAHRVTNEERLEAGMRQFGEMGLEPDDVERMARVVGLQAVDLYLAVSSQSIVHREQSSLTVTEPTVEATPNLSERLRRLEEVFLQNERLASAINQVGQEDIVTHLRRIADHFDPPNVEVVGTSYVAERLGVTQKWVGELVRKKELPGSCICPKSGGGNYWRFWKKPIDKWINER